MDFETTSHYDLRLFAHSNETTLNCSFSVEVTVGHLFSALAAWAGTGAEESPSPRASGRAAAAARRARRNIVFLPSPAGRRSCCPGRVRAAGALGGRVGAGALRKRPPIGWWPWLVAVAVAPFGNAHF